MPRVPLGRHERPKGCLCDSSWCIPFYFRAINETERDLRVAEALTKFGLVLHTPWADFASVVMVGDGAFHRYCSGAGTNIDGSSVINCER